MADLSSFGIPALQAPFLTFGRSAPKNALQNPLMGNQASGSQWPFAKTAPLDNKGLGLTSGQQSVLKLSYSAQSLDQVQISQQGRGITAQAYSRDEIHFQLQLQTTDENGKSTILNIEIDALYERYASIQGEMPNETEAISQPDSLIDQLTDMFSPEATAERIFQFALLGFNEQDDTREAFRDFILPYIEKGYEEAMEMLGPFAEMVQETTSQTMDLVREKFETFVGE